MYKTDDGKIWSGEMVPQHYHREEQASQTSSKGSPNSPLGRNKEWQELGGGGDRQREEKLEELSRKGEIFSQREVENHVQTKPTQPL